MEWNARAPSLWDWENLVALDGKVSESPKHIQATDWGIEGDTGIDNESVYSSGGGGCPGSKSGNGSSSKSFMMASIDSSSSGFNSQTFENCGKDVNEKKYNGSIEGTGTSSPDQVASVGVGEPLIGLKLGKRTYFEDVCAGNGTTKTSSFSVVPTSSTNSVKKTRAPCQSMQNPRCQVEGCNLDLSAAKDYHRRHRVCETHSKCPKVVIAGLERRFCQQCSRFHDLSEFDEKKRSCRRRLSHHNARRRKPQTDMITLNSARLSSPFYDGRQQVNFALNRVPIVHALSSESPSWEGSRDYKLAQAKGSWVTTAKVGGVDGQLLLPRIDMPNATSTIRRDFERPYLFKGNTAQILNQGLEPSVMTSNLDETPDVCRALSLLSNNSWGSADSEPASFNHFMHMTGSQPAIHAASQGFLLNSEYWVAEQPSAESRSRQMTLHSNSNQFQEFQLFKTPYDSAFFSNHHMP